MVAVRAFVEFTAFPLLVVDQRAFRLERPSAVAAVLLGDGVVGIVVGWARRRIVLRVGRGQFGEQRVPRLLQESHYFKWLVVIILRR